MVERSPASEETRAQSLMQEVPRAVEQLSLLTTAAESVL